MKNKIKIFSTNRSVGNIESAPNEESRTIDLVWTTGAKGLRTTRDGFQYFEELAVDNKSIDLSRMVGNPLLASHDSNLDSVIGVIESVSIDPIRKEGRATVRFAKDEYSERVFQKVKDKIIRNTSVGYRIDSFKDVSQKGDEIPTFLAERWTPYEISLVGIGFDPNANIRSEETLTEIEITKTEAETITSITVEPQADLQEKERIMTDAEKQAQELALKKQAALDEKQRQTEIRQAVRAAKLDEVYADELVNQDITSDKARQLVLEKLAAKQPEPINSAVRVEIGTDNEAKRQEGFRDALMHRMDSKNFAVTQAGREFYGKSLLRQLEIIIPRYSMESDVQYAKRAMSSSDLPLALANVAEKGLQKQYELQPRTYSRWTRKDSLRNYKEKSQVKSGDFASLLERKEGAEFKKGSFGEKNEVVQMKDYGIIHSFTSQMLVNDDLGVLSRLASSGGIAAARLENKLAYSALTTNKTMKDSVSLYHASHGNLGAAGAISETTIGELYTKMRKQASTDGLDKLNLNPRFFICGPDQEVAARKFFASIIPNQTSNVNIFQGSMEVIVDAEITGNQYYIAADPNMIDTVVCYHLEGQEQPRIESRIDFSTNNLDLKVDHAFAAEPMDWRGLGKNAGQ